MVGASPEAFERAEPVLRAMGTPHHLGPVGMGETVKLVNQIIIANVMIANVEGARRLPTSRAPISTRFARCSQPQRRRTICWRSGCRRRGSRARFEGGFALDLLRKDLAAALDAARAANLPMPATGLAYQLYTTRSRKGDGALDYSAIAKSYERNRGA